MADNTQQSAETAETPPLWQRRVFVGLPRAVTALLILAGIGINFANVISRYLFGFALYWAEEVMIFLILWCVFLGAVAVAFNGAHLRMDLISARIGPPWRGIVNGLTVAAFVVCGLFVAVQSWKVLDLIASSGDVSVTASVPMVIPHSALLIGMVLMVIAVLLRIGAYLRNRF
jgi:TRAP-type C4-dicarboxylate transport system permease small subunit